jgi:hypothetical protein
VRASYGRGAGSRDGSASTIREDHPWARSSASPATTSRPLPEDITVESTVTLSGGESLETTDGDITNRYETRAD